MWLAGVVDRIGVAKVWLVGVENECAGYRDVITLAVECEGVYVKFLFQYEVPVPASPRFCDK